MAGEPVPVSFGLESRPGKFGPDGGARLINAYPEQTAPDAKAPWMLYCRPGLKAFATLTDGPFRGAIDFGAVAYLVGGQQVNKVDSAGTVTNIGAFVGTGPVFMSRNRKSPNAQVALVSEGQRAIIENDVIANIADTDLPAPVAVDSIGGYFVFVISDGRYFWTAIDEGTDINALDFASAEANPDGLVGIIARNQEIVLFGPKSIEFHVLTGSDAVFERVTQSTLQLGCLSGAAIKSLNGVPIFPASDGTVRMLNAYSPERISTHEVERDIDALADKSTLTAQAFSLEGHHFYCLNSASFTWVCDLLTRKWLDWESFGLSRWRAEGFVDIGGKRISGDHASAALYELDPDTGDDAGAHLLWKMVSGPIGAYPARIIADELFLDLLPGVGLNVVDEHQANPLVTLRTSDDDGKSWSSEMTQSVGRIGDFKREVRFQNLGASGEDGFRFEISMSAPVSRCLQRAALRYSPLTA
jgi:hypothetical protein